MKEVNLSASVAQLLGYCWNIPFRKILRQEAGMDGSFWLIILFYLKEKNKSSLKEQAYE